MTESYETMPVKSVAVLEEPAGSSGIESLDQHVTGEVVKMKKRYNFTSLIAIFIVGTAGWEAIIASTYQVIIGGGPTALVWGFVFSATASCLIAFSLAEFASIWPTAAGQYHWAVALAPNRYKVVVGWFSSWLLLMMNIMSSLSAIFAGCFSLQALVIITIDSYVAQRWHTYLMFLAMISITLAINVFIPRSLHYISLVGTATHVLGFFAVIITLLATTKKKNSAREVFGSLEDFTGYNNNGIAFLVGLLPTATGFSSIDMPARYAEETAKPHTDVSRAMFWGLCVASLIGFPFVLTIAFCMGDPADLLTSEITFLSPLAQIVLNSTGSLAAAVVLASLIVIVAVISAIDCMGGIARIIMAQARDNGLPYGHVFSRIHPRWNTPANACVLAAVIQAVISVIYVGNTTAFYGILSGVFTLQTLSLGLPIFLHLIRRKTLNLKYGPWSLGRHGWIINIVGVLMYATLFVAVSLPTAVPVTAQNMNYAAPIAGMVLILAGILYVVWGRRAYNGPLVDLPGVMVDSMAERETEDVIPAAKEKI